MNDGIWLWAFELVEKKLCIALLPTALVLGLWVIRTIAEPKLTMNVDVASFYGIVH
jgi:hypothetical protein